jgi:hypothetical protein
MANQWEHLGTQITLDERTGKFGAKVGNALRKFVSLDAAKKALDKEAAIAFQARPALRLSYGRTSYEEVSVVGTRSPRKNSWRTVSEWVYRDTSGEEGTTYSVAFDTPENRAAMDALVALKKKNDELRERMKKAEETAEEAITYTTPEPVAAK